MKNIIVVLLVVLFTGCGNIQNSSDSVTVESQIKPKSRDSIQTDWNNMRLNGKVHYQKNITYSLNELGEKTIKKNKSKDKVWIFNKKGFLESYKTVLNSSFIYNPFYENVEWDVDDTPMYEKIKVYDNDQNVIKILGNSIELQNVNYYNSNNPPVTRFEQIINYDSNKIKREEIFLRNGRTTGVNKFIQNSENQITSVSIMDSVGVVNSRIDIKYHSNGNQKSKTYLNQNGDTQKVEVFNPSNKLIKSIEYNTPYVTTKDYDYGHGLYQYNSVIQDSQEVIEIETHSIDSNHLIVRQDLVLKGKEDVSILFYLNESFYPIKRITKKGNSFSRHTYEYSLDSKKNITTMTTYFNETDTIGKRSPIEMTVTEYEYY
jgi:hypothetical protein